MYSSREDSRSRRQLILKVDLFLIRISELQFDEDGKQFTVEATLLSAGKF